MFSKDESEAILMYISETPPAINAILRGYNIKLDDFLVQSSKILIKTFNKITSSLNKEIVYRGVDGDYGFTEDFIIDSLISTSTEYSEALFFTSDDINKKIIMEITLPIGVPFLEIKFLSSTYKKFIPSTEGDERILLPGKMKVRSIHKNFDGVNIIKCDYLQYRDVESTLYVFEEKCRLLSCQE